MCRANNHTSKLKGKNFLMYKVWVLIDDNYREYFCSFVMENNSDLKGKVKNF
jgi:hypothetical protein